MENTKIESLWFNLVIRFNKKEKKLLRRKVLYFLTFCG